LKYNGILKLKRLLGPRIYSSQKTAKKHLKKAAVLWMFLGCFLKLQKEWGFSTLPRWSLAKVNVFFVELLFDDEALRMWRTC